MKRRNCNLIILLVIDFILLIILIPSYFEIRFYLRDPKSIDTVKCFGDCTTQIIRTDSDEYYLESSTIPLQGIYVTKYMEVENSKIYLIGYSVSNFERKKVYVICDIKSKKYAMYKDLSEMPNLDYEIFKQNDDFYAFH